MANSIDLTNDLVITGTPWWQMHWRYSGRYNYRGGAIARARSDGGEIGRESIPTLHKIEHPVFLSRPAPFDGGGGDIAPVSRLRFTLHIDIDGPDPLNVISGTVAVESLAGPLRGVDHFIGRVTSNTANVEGRALVVEDFSFGWPETRETIDRIEIQLRPPLPCADTPSAAVTFITAGRRSHGPYILTRNSAYFREVEVEIDREDGAVDPEPYDTHIHPVRPPDFPRYRLNMEAVYHRAGIKITRAAGETSVIDSTEAGGDVRWTENELHDSMELHWSAFANRAQWKMWIFLAELGKLDRWGNDTLGGMMFDGHIDEPGGVDRQGTAIFTLCPHFHTAGGDYCQANPPAAEAAQRELFFDLVHESGHAFNLYHSFSKTFDPGGVGIPHFPWDAPPWMPVTDRVQALSWINYPDAATADASPESPNDSAQWFYERFEFRFDEYDNLFLRHAPERYVVMGGEEWGDNHGRVLRSSLDPRLELVVRSRKNIFELGEPINVEVRLKNVSDEPIIVRNGLDLPKGLLQLAITDSLGVRRPFIPFLRYRSQLMQHKLKPGEAIYQSLSLVLGLCGSPFKVPGPYRIEASYHNIGGGTAAAIMQLYVRPPVNFDDLPAIHELFNARVGRVLYLGGSRVMEDVNDKLEWVAGKLGKKHPAQYHFAKARSAIFSKPFKVVRPEEKKIQLLQSDHERVETQLKFVTKEPKAAADSLGHIDYEKLVYTYIESALRVRKKAAARTALEAMVKLFKMRRVLPSVIKKAEQRLKKLK